jgi:hypothetical protein
MPKFHERIAAIYDVLQLPSARGAREVGGAVLEQITSIGKRAFFGTAVAVPGSIRSSLKELIGEPAAETIDRICVLEHSLFARLHGRATATTRRSYIFLRGSAEDFFRDPALMLHEYCHVLLQWESGALTVPRYVRECLLHGYWNNCYEVQAREFARRQLWQFRALVAAAAAADRPSAASHP